MSYGPNVLTMVKTAAGYVERIIKGEKPGRSCPCSNPPGWSSVVNLKTAKAFELELPQSLIVRADEVDH